MHSPRKEGQAAQSLSFTSIYDVCKSAKGVCLNRDSMLAAVLADFSMPRTAKREGLGSAEALQLRESRSQFQISATS
jgi:hypothetical protein